MWCANLADIELHTSLSLAGDTSRPTMIVFISIRENRQASWNAAKSGCGSAPSLTGLGLRAFPRPRAPKDCRSISAELPVTYEETKPFARELARTLERQHPELVVSDMKKAVRVGKVFVNWSQNDDHKTTVCVYSLRAKSRLPYRLP